MKVPYAAIVIPHLSTHPVDHGNSRENENKKNPLLRLVIGVEPSAVLGYQDTKIGANSSEGLCVRSTTLCLIYAKK
jgi:hypothetical protein